MATVSAANGFEATSDCRKIEVLFKTLQRRSAILIYAMDALLFNIDRNENIADTHNFIII